MKLAITSALGWIILCVSGIPHFGKVRWFGKGIYDNLNPYAIYFIVFTQSPVFPAYATPGSVAVGAAMADS